MIEINGQKYYTKNDILEIEKENQQNISTLQTIVNNLMVDPYYYRIYDFSIENDIVITKEERATVKKENCKWHITATNCKGWSDKYYEYHDAYPTISTYDGKKYLRIFNRFGIVIDDSGLNVKSVTIAFQNEDMAAGAYNYMTNVGDDYANEVWIDKAEIDGRILTVYADFSKGWNLFGNITRPICGWVKSILIEYVKINVD